MLRPFTGCEKTSPDGFMQETGFVSVEEMLSMPEVVMFLILEKLRL